MTMLKVPKAGMQVEGGEVQGVLLFKLEAIVQRAWREMRRRKVSTRSTEVMELGEVEEEDEEEVMDFGVRSI
jgi:hypothetical protein